MGKSLWDLKILETFLIALILVLNLEKVAHLSGSESCKRWSYLWRQTRYFDIVRKGYNEISRAASNPPVYVVMTEHG